jgi:hypothetical protein
VIIIVESIVDSLSLVQIGVENVQPLYGVNGFTVKTIFPKLTNPSTSRLVSLSNHRVKDWNEKLLAGLGRETFKLLVGEAGGEKKPETEKSFEVSKEGIKDIFKAEQTRPEPLDSARDKLRRGITYEIVGAKDIFITNLRLNVKAVCGEESYYDNADLTSGRSRRSLSETLAQLFGIEYRIVERDLSRILDHYARERDKKLAEINNIAKAVELTEEERKIGLAFLKNSDMFGEIIKDMDILGYVGEDLNKILLYLCASSRILDGPICVMIRSQSASGKSMLVSTLKKLIPPEDVLSLTSLSDQALNYIASMLHKFLDLGEAVHSEAIEHQVRDMLSAYELSRLAGCDDREPLELDEA